MSQFQIPGRRPFPFKAISIRFAYTNFPDTIKFAVMLVLPSLFLLLAYGCMEGFRLAKPFVLGMLKR